MKILCGERQSGKTTALIKQSAETGFYIVCIHRQEALRVARMADELKLFIPFPLTFDEFLNHRYNGRGVKGLLIDESLQLLQSLTYVPVHTITIDSTEMNMVVKRSQP